MTELRPFAELRTTGLLWLINTTVFHPRGYALAITIEQDGNAVGWKLLGDGSEPWVMNKDCDPQFVAASELMPYRSPIPDMIEASSLGTDEAATARASVSTEAATAVVARADTTRP